MQLPPAELLFDEQTIATAIDRIADHLNSKCRGESWLMLCVMNGGLIFTADLMRRLKFAVTLDCIRVSRYHNSTKGSGLTWHSKPATELAGTRVLLIDDIFDEGILNGSIYLGYQSPIGPLYLGYGWAEGGRKLFFLKLGTVFGAQ